MSSSLHHVFEWASGNLHKFRSILAVKDDLSWKLQGHEVPLKLSVKVKNFRCRFVVLFAALECSHLKKLIVDFCVAPTINMLIMLEGFFRKRFQCFQTCQDYPRIHFKIRMSEKHQAFSLDSLCRCSFHGFFHILFTSRVFFSPCEVHFWGLACQGSCWCSCLAAPHHANSFIYKKWSNLHKKRRSAVHWDYNVAVSFWTLGIAETFRGKHHHDTAATDQCYWRCRSYCKRNEHRTRPFEHLWRKFQKNPCHKFFIQHLFLPKHVILILEWDSALSGLGDLVGYSIRLESKRSFRTKILVCTTGQFCQLDGRIWSFWKGQTIQKPCPKADVFRIKQKLSPSTEIAGVKISFTKRPDMTQTSTNINKHQRICCLHELFWIWHTAVEEVCFSGGWKMILNYTMWRISLSTNVVSSGNILVWKVSWRAHAKSEEHFSSWFSV